MLKLELIGYLGKDAEVKNENDKKNVIRFTVAHTEKIKGVEKTVWVNCDYSQDSIDATNFASKLKKGTQVYIEGIPSVNVYSKKDGSEAASFNCQITYLQLLASKS